MAQWVPCTFPIYALCTLKKTPRIHPAQDTASSCIPGLELMCIRVGKVSPPLLAQRANTNDHGTGRDVVSLFGGVELLYLLNTSCTIYYFKSIDFATSVSLAFTDPRIICTLVPPHPPVRVCARSLFRQELLSSGFLQREFESLPDNASENNYNRYQGRASVLVLSVQLSRLQSSSST
ncbi:uncharacterized protein BO95DRAFT_72287 [Aspergillus brunneoviolaceus CBS 621.78]|uniref:Uncharacterized protein n=1 Tax=Aspergillus brunneoviolaceus CBS 621.78 TaxID=1450534 RepID=A0ACD1GFF0_9EURO|nr:hypothetical protein BO95DRAFT_72287 [Aspergillus brunneoviolaceus CBS 621.78]RAH47898.1 hypothetical protein BO95DRAFT_72287 [Aspergillus brunneoviolaceus CBS 621.78]